MEHEQINCKWVSRCRSRYDTVARVTTVSRQFADRCQVSSSARSASFVSNRAALLRHRLRRRVHLMLGGLVILGLGSEEEHSHASVYWAASRVPYFSVSHCPWRSAR